jgi:hypothetical protein
VYLIALLIVVFTLAASISNLNSKIYYICICIVLIILGGFRWGVGTDWSTYLTYFNTNITINEFLDGDIKEYAYALTAFVFKSIFENYTFFLLFQSTIVASIFLFFLYTYSKGSLFVVLLYFLNSIGNIYFVRQTIASAFFLLALHYLIQRKIGRGLFYQFVGVGFHYTSSLLSIFSIFLSKKIFIVIIFALPLFFFLFSEYITSYFLFKFSLYFLSGETNEFFYENYEALTPIKLIWCLYLIFIIYFCKILTIYSNRDNAFSGYFFYFYSVLFVLGIAIPQFNRLTQYFSVFEQIILSLIVAKIKGWLKVYFVIFILILYFAKYYFRISAWPGETDIYSALFSF